MAQKDEEPSIGDSNVLNKFKQASDIVNGTLKKIIGLCVEDAKILDLCELGDKELDENAKRFFKKDKEMRKGIAFPTCISVNNCICHFSPLKLNPSPTLKNGDVVKIDMGVHIDGFIAVVAHTLVVGAAEDNKVTGRKADVILAAHTAAEAAYRLVQPGKENMAVTAAIQKVAGEFKCKPIEGMLSHQLKQHVIDGPKAIIQNPTDAQRKEHEKCEFEMLEAYAVDVLISTGEGKGRVMDAKTTVYKKKDTVYNLKMKCSRQLYSEMNKKFGNMPFTLRCCEDEKKAKMGVVECVKHDLVEPFQVLWEREGEYVAQFKFTVLLLPNGPLKLTGEPFDSNLYQSDLSVQDEDLKKLLATSMSRNENKNKKRQAKKAAKLAHEKSAAEAKSTEAAATPES